MDVHSVKAFFQCNILSIVNFLLTIENNISLSTIHLRPPMQELISSLHSTGVSFPGSAGRKLVFTAGYTFWTKPFHNKKIPLDGQTKWEISSPDYNSCKEDHTLKVTLQRLHPLDSAPSLHVLWCVIVAGLLQIFFPKNAPLSRATRIFDT